jgi:EpsI family protein
VKNDNAHRFAAVVVVLSATLGLSAMTDRRVRDNLLEPLETIPLSLGGWDAVADAPVLPRIADKLNATTLISRSYKRDAREMALFVAYYAQQRAGESMHSPKNCLPGTGWIFLEQDRTSVPIDGKPVDVNFVRIQNGRSKMAMIYWYQSRRRIVASEYMGKLLTMRDALFDGRTAGSLVRVMLPDAPDAADDMRRFAALLIPEIQRCLGN